MIAFNNVSKGFGSQDVLDAVSFTVKPGSRLGIVGPNGAGKSTVFKLITGQLIPDSGTLSIPGDWRIGYVRQHVSSFSQDESLLSFVEDADKQLRQLELEIAAAEEVLAHDNAVDRERQLRELGILQTRYEQLGGYECAVRAKATLSGLGFATASFHEPLSSFSGGWQMRAELARALVTAKDLLLLDEPTNYLDVPAVEWLTSYIDTFSGTFLLVSHDRYLLTSLTTATLEISGGQATYYPGNYRYYTTERVKRHAQLAAAKKNQDRKREQIERFVERFRAKNTKASQVQSRLKMLEQMEDIQVPGEAFSAPRIKLPHPKRSGAQVVQLEDLRFRYSDDAPWLFDGTSLRIERGEKMAVVGLNGTGKTTLLKILAGILKPAVGRYRPGHNVSMGYLSQDFTETLPLNETVFSTAKASGPGASDSEVRNLLGGFSFSGSAIDKTIKVLSGGEKVRLALACLLLGGHNFLILDEPTTHLDIRAREALEEALAAYAGTVCFVSHDIAFVRRVATGVFTLRGGQVHRYHGGYDYYREKLVAERSGTVADTQPTTSKQPARKSQREKARKREEAQRRQRLYQERRPLENEVAALEERIDSLEAEQRSFVEVLHDTAATGTEYQKASVRLAEIQTELREASEEWEEVSLQLERLVADYEEQ